MRGAAVATFVALAVRWKATGPGQSDVAGPRLARHARPVPETSEVTMINRRIITSVCALCLAFPAGAVASPGTDPPKPQGPYGVTAGTAAPNSAKVKGPYGITPSTRAPVGATVRGPYGVTPDIGAPINATVKGPYGVTPVAATTVTAHRATGSDTTNEWRIVAISEAALLAALALGSAGLVAGRRRAPHMAT
jgi:hypothetical protein